jgi:hypothetical protein
MALSEDAAENVNAGPLSTFPATTSHNVEPQQASPALGPRYGMSHIPWVADIDLFVFASSDLPVLSPFGPLTSHLPTPQR